ncbi:MAG: stalk domain-containing protein [Peptococcaceae bacterium]|nr:stalk domain-containing protein [Peptococcaceae bacterium]
MVSAPVSYSYTGVWQGQTKDLTLVTNVTVEGLSDAKLVGQISNFYTNEPSGASPPYYKLDGGSINVWTAPAEFPGVYVVHNGDQGNQPTYGTWTFPMTSSQTVAGYTVSAPAQVTFGNPFTFTVTAVDANGNTVTSADNTVDLSSSTNNVLFTDANVTPSGPATVTLANGVATVDAVDNVPESVTINVVDSNGDKGSAQLAVVQGQSPGVSMAINGGTAQTVADIDFIDYDNGVNANGCHGGFWPLGVGTTYSASWSGYINITQAGTYQFLNVADDTGSASITVNGQSQAIPTNSWTQGTNAPLSVLLTPGSYAVLVSQQETDGQGGAGDTLKWNPPGGIGLVPIPASAFGTAATVGPPAAYKVTVSSPQDFGAPFTFTVAAVDAVGNTVTSADNTVDLTSSTNNVLFTNATLTSGQSAAVTLTNGVATVNAVDNVPESTTITASSTGLTGSAQLTVVIGPHLLWQSPGVTVTVNGGTPQTVADIDFIDYDNGVNTNGCHGGFWPLGVGSTYSATWKGTLRIVSAGTYQFLNVADDTGSATITVNGQSQSIPTNSWTQGTNAPLSIQLTPGSFAVSVSQQETDGQGGAGDTLKWNPPGGSGLVPIPTSAFGSGILPVPLSTKIDFTIGSDQYVSDGTSHTIAVAPFIQDSRTYVPIRFMGYAIGMSDSDIVWNQNNNTATFNYAGKVLEFTLGSSTYTVNGTPYQMDVTPIDQNGRICVPARYFGDAFGYTASWNANTQEVELSRS